MLNLTSPVNYQRVNWPPDRPINPIKIVLIEEHPAVRIALLTRFRESPLVEQIVASFDLEIFSDWFDCDVLLIGLPLLKQDDLALQILMKRLREKNIPIVALTSYAHDDEHNMMRSAGVSAYMLKNIDTQHLIDSIMNIVYEAQNKNGRG